MTLAILNSDGCSTNDSAIFLSCCYFFLLMPKRLYVFVYTKSEDGGK